MEKSNNKQIKFIIDNVEYETYQLSNGQVRELLYREDLSPEERDVLMKCVLDRFTYNLCPKCGETEDDVFARFFSNYVNRCPNDFNRAANTMAHDHRYLQNEMFKVCLAYIKKLAESFDSGIYDARNSYACEKSYKIVKMLNNL